MDRIDWDRDADAISTGDDLRLEYRGAPYTGEIVQHGVENLLSQEFYTDGVADGPTRQWWSDGSPRSDGQMRYGRAYGDFRRWHKNGQLASVKHFDDSGALLSIEEWDEAGNKTRG